MNHFKFIRTGRNIFRENYSVKIRLISTVEVAVINVSCVKVVFSVVEIQVLNWWLD